MTASASPGVRPRRSGGSSSPTPEAPSPPPPPAATPSPCVLAADGSYAARLTLRGGARHAERWTLDGPEPYAVPLPTDRPEEPGTEVLPLTDGRVLVHRVEPAAPGARHLFSLLYPTGPGTGELALGSVECADPGTVLRLLPPSPAGTRAYALAAGPDSTAVWLIAGGDFGPEHLAEVPGHCSGGVWLDTTGRMLALDRTRDGRTKTVVVDLERGGEMSPLLQIAEDSDDRLLLADADSGLLLIRSDAPSPAGSGSAGGAGQHAAGQVPPVPAGGGVHGDAVRDPAGADPDARGVRGGPAGRRRRRLLARPVAPRRATARARSGARGLAAGHRPLDPRGRAAPAVRDARGTLLGGPSDGTGGAARAARRGSVTAP